MNTARTAHMSSPSEDRLPAERYALDVIAASRELYTRHFDNGWLMTILERHSFNGVYLQDIRRLIELNTLYPSDYYRLLEGTKALEEFIRFCRHCVLPVLREELGLSGFERFTHAGDDRTVRVVKGFFAYTFPSNLDKLADLTARLRESAAGLTRAG
jgi:hypothetical protein